jgi:hypothetical protein
MTIILSCLNSIYNRLNTGSLQNNETVISIKLSCNICLRIKGPEPQEPEPYQNDTAPHHWIIWLAMCRDPCCGSGRFFWPDQDFALYCSLLYFTPDWTLGIVSRDFVVCFLVSFYRSHISTHQERVLLLLKVRFCIKFFDFRVRP